MAARLRAAGMTATVAPMLQVVFEPDVAARILAIGDAAALVFTSAAGVAALGSDPASERLHHLPVAAVGPATAAAARDGGFVQVISADGDGAAAAAAVMTASPSGGTIVHVAGRDMAFDVAAALVAAGRDARTIVAYRSEAADRLDRSLRRRSARAISVRWWWPPPEPPGLSGVAWSRRVLRPCRRRRWSPSRRRPRPRLSRFSTVLSWRPSRMARA